MKTTSGLNDDERVGQSEGLKLIADIFLILASFYHLLGALYGVGALRYKEGGESYSGSLAVHIPAYKEDPEIVKRSVKRIMEVLHPDEIIIVTDPESYEQMKREIPEAKVLTGAEKGKAHALNVAIHHTKSRKIIVFDADSYPDRRFKVANSKASASLWKGYPSKGRWSEAIATLTTLASVILMSGRKALGLKVLPPGSGVTVDTELIKNYKWSEDVLTEDLDLGVRLHASGIEVELNDGFVYVEAPPGYFELKKQQSRWCYGATEALKKLKIKDLRDVELFFYLTQYAYTWLPLLALLSSPLGLNLGTLLIYYGSVTLQAIVSKKVAQKYDLKFSIKDSARSSAAGLAMSLSLLRATLRSLLNKGMRWEVTPKGGKRAKGKLFGEYFLLPLPILSIFNPISLPLALQYALSSAFVIIEERR